MSKHHVSLYLINGRVSNHYVSLYFIHWHLGKGSYSDVFEVVYSEGKFGNRMSSSAVIEGTRPEGVRPPSRGRRATLTMTAPTDLLRPAQSIGHEMPPPSDLIGCKLIHHRGRRPCP